MKKVMFLCHGNICRSPIAEFVFKKLTKGCDIHIESKSVSSEEIGNSIYPKAADILRKKGIDFSGHIARKFTKEDYEIFDYIIIMENYNLNRLLKIIDNDNKNKVYRLLDFTEESGDIEDPWYSGNFEKVYNQIYEGCKGLLTYLQQNNEI